MLLNEPLAVTCFIVGGYVTFSIVRENWASKTDKEDKNDTNP